MLNGDGDGNKNSKKKKSICLFSSTRFFVHFFARLQRETP